MPYPHLGLPAISFAIPLPQYTPPPFSYVTPANEIRRILGFFITFAMSGASGIRIPGVSVISPDGFTLCGIESPRSAQANQTIGWSAAIGNGVVDNPNNYKVFTPLFDVLLLPGWAIKFFLNNQQPGDQITFLSILFERWEV